MVSRPTRCPVPVDNRRATLAICQAAVVAPRRRRDENPWPPTASWVLGRSARWHTVEGEALLAQDGLAEERRDRLRAFVWWLRIAERFL